MSTDKHSVKVLIDGEEFTVRSELPPDYTKSVAAYFDAALARVRSSIPTVESHKAAILAGLAVTDELFQARQADSQLSDEIHQLIDEVVRFLPPARRGASRPGPQLTLGD